LRKIQSQCRLATCRAADGLFSHLSIFSSKDEPERGH
jgi:hypothetical protein